MKESFDDLLQRVLEGSATPEERTRVNTMSAADPALRRRREELEQVFLLLGSARLEPAPAGLRETILDAIRDEAPLPSGGERSTRPAGRLRRGPPWGRLLLPVAGLLVAVIMVWAVRAPWMNSAGPVSGTMSGSRAMVSVSLGDGAAAVRVEGRPEAGGFRLEVRAGDVPVTVEFIALDPGTRLADSAGAAAGVPGTLTGELDPRAHWQAHGRGTARVAPIQVRVRFPDGRTIAAELRVPTHDHPGGP